MSSVCPHGNPDSCTPHCLSSDDQLLRAEKAREVLDEYNIVNSKSEDLKQWILTGEWPERDRRKSKKTS